MIIERNIFQIKFGKAKEAIAIWKEIMEESKNSALNIPEMRLLTDLSGESYTLIMELQLKNFNEINPKQAIWSTTEKFQTLYQKFIPLCDSARRVFYNVEATV